MRKICLTTAVLLIAACSGQPSLTDDALTAEEFELQEFFNGKSVAYGQFQDTFGTVRTRFKVDIDGSWDGETLTLVEDFAYDDGSSERRIWTLVQSNDEAWVGSAPGVIGNALGQEDGDRFNWSYTIDLPLGAGDTMRVKFDDWMWLLAEDRILNKAYMSKYGVPLGEVTILFEK